MALRTGMTTALPPLTATLRLKKVPLMPKFARVEKKTRSGQKAALQALQSRSVSHDGDQLSRSSLARYLCARGALSD